jgi:hypothetical protein
LNYFRVTAATGGLAVRIMGELYTNQVQSDRKFPLTPSPIHSIVLDIMQKHKNNNMTSWKPLFNDCGYILVSANDMGGLSSGRDVFHMLFG